MVASGVVSITLRDWLQHSPLLKQLLYFSAFIDMPEMLYYMRSNYQYWKDLEEKGTISFNDICKMMTTTLPKIPESSGNHWKKILSHSTNCWVHCCTGNNGRRMKYFWIYLNWKFWICSGKCLLRNLSDDSIDITSWKYCFIRIFSFRIDWTFE